MVPKLLKDPPHVLFSFGAVCERRKFASAKSPACVGSESRLVHSKVITLPQGAVLHIR